MPGYATDSELWTASDGLSRLSFAGLSHPGRVRTVNEDSSLVAPPVFLVADGMGGYERGDVASRLVVESFEPLAGQPAVQPEDLDAAIKTSRHRVEALAAGQAAAPGSTLVAAAYVLEDGRGYWLVANIGDSRAYAFTNGALEQLSMDHSVVQELIDAGELTRDEALGHPERHVITRAIGGLADSQADFALVPASPGSRLLLCSDGLHSEISDTAISHILSVQAEPAETARLLVDAAVSAGGSDNVTVIVVDVHGRGEQPEDITRENTRPSPGEQT